MYNDLKHFGILGMRWGKRKTPEQLEKEKARNLKKAQDKWVKKANKRENIVAAYNKAVDYTNSVLIPKINKKYAKYDWSKLDVNDIDNPKNDPKLAKSYKRYMQEYNDKFMDIFDLSMQELIGKKPE